jgi:hypothetical protein
MVGFVFPFSIPYTTLDPALADMEKAFNYAGYCPIVNTFSGMIRQFFGVVELVCAVAAVVFNILRGFFIEDWEEKIALIEDSQFILNNYARHGIANIFRGQIESIILINFLLFFYDSFSQVRLTYEKENGQEHKRVFAPLKRVNSGFFVQQ